MWGGLADLCQKATADEWSRFIDQIMARSDSASGKTRSRCAIKRSMCPGWFDATGSRALRRWNCAMTQHIW